jgi:DedD protein
MERRARERLIGAGILVALAVIVVPELLSGPKPEAARVDATMELPRPTAAPGPVRNVTVDLTTSKAVLPASPAAAPPTPPSASPPTVTSAPSFASSSSNPDTPGAASSPVTAAAPQAASPVAAAAPPKSAAGFAAQLGSFANRSNAESLVHQLKGQGYAVYMLSDASGKTARYRVRVGPLNDREAAERTIAKLKAAGHAATLVAPR